MNPLPLNDTATIESASGFNSAGEETFGAGVDVKCRFERTTLYSRSPDAKIASTDAVIFFAPSTAVAESDRITVTRAGSTYIGTAISIEPLYDVSGVHTHKEVLTKTV